MFKTLITQDMLREFYKLHQGNKREEELNKSIKSGLAIGSDVEPGHYTARLEARYVMPSDWKDKAIEQLVLALGDSGKVILAQQKALAETGKTASHILKVEHKPTRK